MIALLTRNAMLPSSMFDFNASQDGRFGWFLLTWHPEEDVILEEIQIQIKMDIRNSALGQTSQVEIESWLKSYFSEFHWKLHAIFRKTNLKEKGISLFLGVFFDNELYIVEFGRMLCGMCAKDSIQEVGRSWTNFHVKSLDEMTLLGMSESDIAVKPKRFLLPEKHRLIVLPSSFTEKLLMQNIDCAMIETIMQSVFDDTNGSYFILDAKPKQVVKRRPRLRRFQISAFVIILITLLAILYMQFGNRWLESTGKKIKLLLSSKSSLTVEQIPQYLNIQSENIKRQLQKIERYANQPARDIKLTETWQTDLDFLITAAPSFDFKNIYITSDDKLLAFDKNTKKLEWQKAFDADIKGVTVIRGNLIVFLDNQEVVSLKNGNTIAWSKPFMDKFPARQSLTPLEISSDNDPRINGSILIVPAEKGIYIYDVNSGDSLSEVSFDKRLQFLSKYDEYNNCFYAVVADGIHCISLDILN